MFAEKLAQKTMDEWLTDSPALFCPEAGAPAWKTIRPEHRAEIAALGEEYGNKPYPMRPATGFLAFVRGGSRKTDEDPYFFRRRKLCAAALACCAGTGDQLDAVLDGIWCICEETSWVISAHNVNPIPGAPAPAEVPLPDPGTPYVDLFAAQTGMILSLTRRMLGKELDRISPVITRRIDDELDRRILIPFMENDDFWWMGFRRKDLNNWTPWIVSNVMACAFLRGMERQKLAALLDCLEMLENAAGGKLTFREEEKIRHILRFPLLAEIGSGWFLNFADCDARPFLSGERLQLAGEWLADSSLSALGNRLRGTLSDQLKDTPHLTRALSLLFHPPAAEAEEGEREDVWLPDLQIRVVRRGGWTLGCKGGHNGENHNHNDVGSFLLYLDGAPEIVDAGNMTYTAKTFSDERYSLWNTRSAYHNLPLIGGYEQRAGTAYRAQEVQCLPDGLRLDLAEAYDPAAGVLRCLRKTRLTKDGLTVTDQIETAEPESVCWVFLFRNKPQNNGGWLETERLRLRILVGVEMEIEEIPVTDPRMAASFPGSLWRVSMTEPAAAVHKQIWQFQKKGREISS